MQSHRKSPDSIEGGQVKLHDLDGIIAALPFDLLAYLHGIIGIDAFMKLLLDISLSIVILIVSSPILVLIALLIRLDSHGPVIYRRRVMGINRTQFEAFKFRTMVTNGEDILDANPELRDQLQNDYKLKDDPRVTRVGKFLRAASLDELPQLFHVLSGKMSLVGPRPVTQKEINDYYKEATELCFSVPPGITGLWQVTGRSGTTYEYRIGLDSWYVRNWNVWLDIAILFKTAAVVIKREGAW